MAQAPVASGIPLEAPGPSIPSLERVNELATATSISDTQLQQLEREVAAPQEEDERSPRPLLTRLLVASPSTAASASSASSPSSAAAASTAAAPAANETGHVLLSVWMDHMIHGLEAFLENSSSSSGGANPVEAILRARRPHLQQLSRRLAPPEDDDGLGQVSKIASDPPSGFVRANAALKSSLFSSAEGKLEPDEAPFRASAPPKVLGDVPAPKKMTRAVQKLVNLNRVKKMCVAAVEPPKEDSQEKTELSDAAGSGGQEEEKATRFSDKVEIMSNASMDSAEELPPPAARESYGKRRQSRKESVVQLQATRWLEENFNQFGREDQEASIKAYLTHVHVPRIAWQQLFQMFVRIATLYALISTPVLLSFHRPPSAFISACEVLCEIILIASVADPFVYGITDPETNEVVSNFREVLKMSIWSLDFICDVLSAVPWHALWLISGATQSVLLQLTLLRMLRLPQLVLGFVSADDEVRTHHTHIFSKVNPNLMRVIKLSALFFLMVHLVACGYRSVGSQRDGSTWAYYAADKPSIFNEWVQAMYWALCGVLGENMQPEDFSESTYNSIVVAIGIMLNSCIVGSITSLIGSLDENAAKHKKRLDAVNMFMSRNHVDPEIGDQVLQYYRYMFSSVSRIGSGLFDDLSSSLRLKIDVCIRSATSSANAHRNAW
eukprot:TRINITY_DN21712_c0_g1_i3.p1 TRINITY_DN21712_c0_g1~~TRINITY_DN21712_c0_g1_i3.p1  ORF type:complete len:668 (+),score=168.51 TRINITY_DN21712_c0_g1_i3:360-2363(+)